MATHNLEELLVAQLMKHHLLTASQLVENLAQDGKPFNKTSVYRALDRLLAISQICEHYFNAAQGLVYELRSHHHDHVACENCGQVWVSECRDNQGLADGKIVGRLQMKTSRVASVMKSEMQGGSAAVNGMWGGGAKIDASPLPSGFVITHHHQTLFGLCEQCRRIVTQSAKHPAAQ